MSLAYYILPAIAITLKIRRRKLSFSSTSASSSVVESVSSTASIDTSFEQKFAPKDKQFDSIVASECKSKTTLIDTLASEKITFESFAVKLSTKVTGLILQR